MLSWRVSQGVTSESASMRLIEYMDLLVGVCSSVAWWTFDTDKACTYVA